MFLLLLPRAILSDPVGSHYDHYIHNAHRNYQLWMDATSTFNWPAGQIWSHNPASSTLNNISCPEADIHLDEVLDKHCCTNTDQCRNNCQLTQRLILRSRDQSTCDTEEFDEGPFFKMLFKLLLKMPTQPYQVNLHLISIVSKLALMPHPILYEYLLNPMLPTAKKTQTLFKVLQEVAKRLTAEIPRLKYYDKLIENTRQNLMSHDPNYDENCEHNQLVESLVVMEEFCKELAAIAFVRYQHAQHASK